MAGFNIAVTGLKASSTMLDVAGNNIANSSTVGFKSSRAEFGDIYTASVVGAGSSNTPGSGVTVTDIAQDFSSGTLEFTNNNLDLSINGSGFFQLDDQQGGITYTRAGAFELDKEGYVVSKDGKRLQGYGLDDKENRLPIGDLAVTQKEYPPKATSDMDLALNIDAREDATTLLPNYDKDKAGSYTYSTTVRTYDSLGNEHTIKYNFVEQRPENEYNQYVASIGTTPAISGFTLPFALPASGDADEANGFVNDSTSIDNGDTELWRLSGDGLADLQSKDPRILAVEYYLPAGATTGDGELRVITKSDSIEYGDVAVVNSATSDVYASSENDSTGFVSSNHQEFFEFNAANFTQNISHTVKIEGVEISISTGDGAATEPVPVSTIAAAIAARESDIIESNPLIQSVTYDADQGINGSIKIVYKPDVSASEVTGSPVNVSEAVATGTAGLFGAASAVDVTVTSDLVIEGDNSYDGVYRVYAYLNGDTALDLGRKTNPDPSSTDIATAPGPILLKYNPTNGLLSSVNGEAIVTGAAVPELTIKGADPANPNNVITLNLEGSTQFASDSIIKASDQDGYAKGDLIGVSFAGTGEMIAAFSNGEELKIGVVSIASFENQAGLQPSGDTEWSATLASGGALLNPPGTGLNGLLNSASLEQSNVDLSAELVKLIEAQRNFQANSKTLETLNTVTQSILQI